MRHIRQFDGTILFKRGGVAQFVGKVTKMNSACIVSGDGELVYRSGLHEGCYARSIKYVGAIHNSRLQCGTKVYD